MDEIERKMLALKIIEEARYDVLEDLLLIILSKIGIEGYEDPKDYLNQMIRKECDNLLAHYADEHPNETVTLKQDVEDLLKALKNR